jgi:maleate isomerase
LLADAKPHRIAFHCTAVSTYAPNLAPEIRARIEAASGIAASSTADAILAAVAQLNAPRVTLVTPYIASVHAREIGFLESAGIEIAGGGWMDVATNDAMARIPPPRSLIWREVPWRTGKPTPASSVAPPFAPLA